MSCHWVNMPNSQAPNQPSIGSRSQTCVSLKLLDLVLVSLGFCQRPVSIFMNLVWHLPTSFCAYVTGPPWAIRVACASAWVSTYTSSPHTFHRSGFSNTSPRLCSPALDVCYPDRESTSHTGCALTGLDLHSLGGIFASEFLLVDGLACTDQDLHQALQVTVSPN